MYIHPYLNDRSATYTPTSISIMQHIKPTGNIETHTSRFQNLTRPFCAVGERQGDDLIVPGEFDLVDITVSVS